MLKRRKPPRSGIQRAPRRQYPAHRKWVRGHECAAKRRDEACAENVEAAHVRIGADGGKSLKPSDWFTYPLCSYHHRGVQHAKGERTFEAEYFPKGLRATALEYAKRSPVYFSNEEFREGVNAALRKA